MRIAPGSCGCGGCEHAELCCAKNSARACAGTFKFHLDRTRDQLKKARREVKRGQALAEALERERDALKCQNAEQKSELTALRLSAFRQIDDALIGQFSGHELSRCAWFAVLEGYLEGKAGVRALRTSFQSLCPSGGLMRRALGSWLTRRSAACSPTGSASKATRMRFGVQASAHVGRR